MLTESIRRQRTVVDFLVILFGVALVGMAIWAAPIFLGEAERELRNVNLAWSIYFFSGFIAILSQFVGQWYGRRMAARGMLVTSVVLLLIGLTAFDTLGPRALTTMLLPAVVFLIALPVAGPMPDPDGPLAAERARERTRERIAR